MRYYLILLFTLIIGYSSEWVAYYVKLFNGNSISLIGKLSSYETVCNTPREKSAYCTNRYQIPYQKIKGKEFLGAGIIISASSYFCSNKPDKSIDFDIPTSPGRRFDLMNLYQTIDLKTLDCKSDLIVEAWSRNGAVRKGYQSGLLITGNPLGVERVKNLSEFFSKEFPRILGILFIMLIFLYTILGKLFNREMHHNIFSSSLLLWTIFVTSSSGILQTIFPITAYPLFINKIVAFFSLYCHSLPVFLFLSDIKIRNRNYFRKPFNFLQTKRKQALNLTPLAIIFIIALSSKLWVTFFILWFFLLGSSSIIFGVIKRNHILISYGIITTLVTFKISNYNFMPSSKSTIFFVGTFLLVNILKRIKNLAILSESIQTVKDFSNSKSNKVSIDALEKDIFSLLKVGQLTYLIINEKGGCKIKQYTLDKKGIKVNTFERETLPPLFAHIISKSESLWHEHQDSDFLRQIKSKTGGKQKYKGEYLTSIPLYGFGKTYGAIAFTNYPETYVKNKEKSLELEMYLDILLPIYCEKINLNIIANKNSITNKFHTIDKLIDDIYNNIKSQHSNIVNLSIIMNDTLKVINQELSSYGYLTELNHNSKKLNLLALGGYPEDITERFKKGSIFAHEENRHGPLPLSINERRVIIIPDVSLYKEVYHEFTNYFFGRCNTKSCVSIPIYDLNNDDHDGTYNSRVWGAIFIERNIEDRFNGEMINLFENISYKLSKLIQKLNNKKIHIQTEENLRKFIPEKNYSQILQDNSYQEKDQGYLLMIDLRESTKISNLLGNKTWNTIASEIKDEIIKYSIIYKISLQDFTWDAFFLTYSSELQDDIIMAHLILFLSKVKNKIDDIYAKFTGHSLAEFLNSSTPKARVAICFGDITRGLLDGPTRSWSITGTEMANVNKLEGICKTIQKMNPYAIIFADDSCLEFFNKKEWFYTNSSVPSNSRKIYSYHLSWAELDTFKIKKAAA